MWEGCQAEPCVVHLRQAIRVQGLVRHQEVIHRGETEGWLWGGLESGSRATGLEPRAWQLGVMSWDIGPPHHIN